MSENDDPKRFSDAQLTQLRIEFDTHKEEYKQQMRALSGEVHENTRITKQLAASMKGIADSTAGVVQLYNDVKSTARVGTGLQQFMLWLAKWGIVGAGAIKLIEWAVSLVKH